MPLGLAPWARRRTKHNETAIIEQPLYQKRPIISRLLWPGRLGLARLRRSPGWPRSPLNMTSSPRAKPLFDAVRANIVGACDFCTRTRFGAADAAERLGVSIISCAGRRRVPGPCLLNRPPDQLPGRFPSAKARGCRHVKGGSHGRARLPYLDRPLFNAGGAEHASPQRCNDPGKRLAHPGTRGQLRAQTGSSGHDIPRHRVSSPWERIRCDKR